MKKAFKALPFWIILLILAMGLSACKTPNKNPVTSDDTTGSQEPTAPVEDPYTPSVDLTALDYKAKEIRILQCSYKVSEFCQEIENTEDVLEEALFKRNERVETDLNVTLKFPTVNNGSGQYVYLQAEVTNSVMGGDPSTMYHIVANPAYYASGMVTAGLYADLASFDSYVNLDKQYWSQSFSEANTLNDRYYFLVGELCTSVLDGLEVVFVNNSLANNYFDSLDFDFYEMVYDQEWTYSKMLELIELAGEGESTQTWGMAIPCNSHSIDGLLCGFELDILGRHENGIPYVNVNTAHNFDIITALRTLYYNNPSVTTNNAGKVFTDGAAIFHIERMDSAPNFYNAGVDYTILPTPKWNAEQTDYTVITHDEYTALSVCNNLTNEELTMISAVLEDMCYRSHTTTYPAVYEKIYQLKYNDSPENVEMFDYINQHLTYSIGYVYSYALGEAKNTPRYLLYPESNTWVANVTYPIQSTLSTLAGTVSTKLEELLTYMYK